MKKVLLLLDGFSSTNLSVKEISRDLGVLGRIVAQIELEKNQELYEDIYSWCLQQAKGVVKLKLSGKVEEITKNIKKITIKV